MRGKFARHRVFRVGVVFVRDATRLHRSPPDAAGDFQREWHRIVAGIGDHHGEGAVLAPRRSGPKICICDL